MARVKDLLEYHINDQEELFSSWRKEPEKMTSAVARNIYVNIGKSVLMKFSGHSKRFWKKSFLSLKFLRKGQFLPFRAGQHISVYGQKNGELLLEPLALIWK